MATLRKAEPTVSISNSAGTSAGSSTNTSTMPMPMPMTTTGAYTKLTLHPDPYVVCDAVKLMTTRMESNIQEFYLTGDRSKFGDMTYAVRSRIQDPEKNKDKLFILNDTEIQFYWNAYIKESKRALHEEVMARILMKDDEADDE